MKNLWSLILTCIKCYSVQRNIRRRMKRSQFYFLYLCTSLASLLKRIAPFLYCPSKKHLWRIRTCGKMWFFKRGVGVLYVVALLVDLASHEGDLQREKARKWSVNSSAANPGILLSSTVTSSVHIGARPTTRSRTGIFCHRWNFWIYQTT